MEKQIEKVTNEFFKEVNEISVFDFPQYQNLYGEPLKKLIDSVVQIAVEETIDRLIQENYFEPYHHDGDY